MRSPAGALIFLCSAAAAAVTLRGPADVASLVVAADAVVHARVIKQQSGWADGGPSSGLIFTTVELQALEWWKGTPSPASPALRLRVPGGQVGELGQLSQGAPLFREGEEVVVFLRKVDPASALYAVERWSLGKFAVRPAASGEPRALRSREGVTCRECRPGEPDELSLAELRARVREAAQ